MGETRSILEGVVDGIDAGRPFAVALIVEAEGSTPRPLGTRAVIDADGAIDGTIGGGSLEAEAQRRAPAVCARGRPMVFEATLAGAAGGDAEPLCGGRARVLLDPTAHKDRAAYAAAIEALARREAGLLVTRLVHAPELATSVAWYPAGGVPVSCAFPDVAFMRACLAGEEPRRCAATVAGAEHEAVVEPLTCEPRLLIAGGGHIGQALARQAVALGFEVTVIDDRREFIDPERYPLGVSTRMGNLAAEIASVPIGPDTYVAIVTRGHQHDAAALAACIRSGAAYVGMIGSKRKVALLRAEFVEAGRAGAEEFDRVFAPIGLDIGAVTVPEIATSIAAQLVAVRRKGAAAARAAGMPRA